MALVEAARYFTRFEASLAKARLEAAGIPCFLFDMEMNWGGADLGVVPARLMVDDDDLEAARQLLEEAPPEAS
jgi:hypothetical protein